MEFARTLDDHTPTPAPRELPALSPDDPMPTVIQGSAEAHAVIGETVYDFYRCYDCERLLTQPELMRRLQACTDGTLCPRCGGCKVHPVGPNIGMTWTDWVKPRVILFVMRRVRERLTDGRIAA